MAGRKEYRVRESPRAGRVRLELSLREGLVVVVPEGFDRGRIPAILEEKDGWLERAQARLARRSAVGAACAEAALPDKIALQAIGAEFKVGFLPSRSAGIRIVEGDGRELILCGGATDAEAARAALRAWVVQKAKGVLPEWANVLARQRGFRFGRVSVKCQKTRWGSCSSRKTISLNCKLLFLPPEWVEYVMLHELCHTVHMNHSQEFWALLERHDPGYRSRDAALQTAWKRVPGWF